MLPAIEIISLSVVYRPPNGLLISALQRIQLEVCKGQLVGLLGHYGAGKSSLLKVIAGQLEPSAGSVRVNGFDVVTEPEAAIRQVGYCRGEAVDAVLPPIVILDEPEVSMAWRAQAQVREQGRTLLLATSRPSLAAQLCERVLVIDRGQLVADIPAADLQRELKDHYYRIRVKGCLPLDWSDWFGNLGITADGPDTILDGYLPDQAALHSVLEAIGSLNLPLLSVQYMERDLHDLIDSLRGKHG